MGKSDSVRIAILFIIICYVKLGHSFSCYEHGLYKLLYHRDTTLSAPNVVVFGKEHFCIFVGFDPSCYADNPDKQILCKSFTYGIFEGLDVAINFSFYLSNEIFRTVQQISRHTPNRPYTAYVLAAKESVPPWDRVLCSVNLEYMLELAKKSTDQIAHYNVSCDGVQLNEEEVVSHMLTFFSNSSHGQSHHHILVLKNGEVYIYDENETRLHAQIGNDFREVHWCFEKYICFQHKTYTSKFPIYDCNHIKTTNEGNAKSDLGCKINMENICVFDDSSKVEIIDISIKNMEQKNMEQFNETNKNLHQMNSSLFRLFTNLTDQVDRIGKNQDQQTFVGRDLQNGFVKVWNDLKDMNIISFIGGVIVFILIVVIGVLVCIICWMTRSKKKARETNRTGRDKKVPESLIDSETGASTESLTEPKSPVTV